MFKLNEQQQAILEQAQVILTKVMEEKPFLPRCTGIYWSHQ